MHVSAEEDTLLEEDEVPPIRCSGAVDIQYIDSRTQGAWEGGGGGQCLTNLLTQGSASRSSAPLPAEENQESYTT